MFACSHLFLVFNYSGPSNCPHISRCLLAKASITQAVSVSNTPELAFDGYYIFTHYQNGRPHYKLLETATHILFENDRWNLMTNDGVVIAESHISSHICPTASWSNNVVVAIAAPATTLLQGEDASITTQVEEQGIAPGFDSITRSIFFEGASPEVQRISVIADSNITGIFSISFLNTMEKVKIKWNEEASDFALKLESLPYIGKIVVRREKNLNYGFDWLVTFADSFKNLPLLSTLDTHLRGTNTSVIAFEERKGQSIRFGSNVDNLRPGVKYHGQVSSINAVGIGQSSTHHQNTGNGLLPLSIVTNSVPGVPSLMSAWAMSDSQIGVSFMLPSDNGDPIKEFKVEWTSGDDFGLHRVLRIELTSINDSDLVGYFFLVVNGLEDTQPLDIQSTPLDISAALNNLPSIGAVVVNEGNTTSEFNKEWLITFVQDIGNSVELEIDCRSIYKVQLDGDVQCIVETMESGMFPSDYG